MKPWFFVVLMAGSVSFSSAVHGKNKSVMLGKSDALKRAIAENQVFKCAANTTYATSEEGAKLEKSIQKSCQEPVQALKSWYPNKETHTKRANLLLANGRRSALAHRSR